MSGIKRKANTTGGLPSKRVVSSECSRQAVEKILQFKYELVTLFCFRVINSVLRSNCRQEAKGQKYDFIALDAVSFTYNYVAEMIVVDCVPVPLVAAIHKLGIFSEEIEECIEVYFLKFNHAVLYHPVLLCTYFV